MDAVTPYMLQGAVPFPPAGVGSPLSILPPVSIVARRLIEMAEARQLVACPQWYQPRLDSRFGGGTPTATWQIVADSNEGPIFVVDVGFPSGFRDAPASTNDPILLQVQTGARILCDGASVTYDDAIALPRALGRRPIGDVAPIIAMRGDTVQLTMRRTAGDNWTTGTPLSVLGFVLRDRNGARVGDEADEIARTLLLEGEWYACGVSPAASSIVAAVDTSAQANYNSDCIVTRLSIVAPTSVVEGAAAASAWQAWVGNYQVTPQQQAGALSAVSLNTRYVQYQDDVRMPVAKGRALRLSSIYPAGTPQPVRLTTTGRRVMVTG